MQDALRYNFPHLLIRKLSIIYFEYVTKKVAVPVADGPSRAANNEGKFKDSIG